MVVVVVGTVLAVVAGTVVAGLVATTLVGVGWAEEPGWQRQQQRSA